MEEGQEYGGGASALDEETVKWSDAWTSLLVSFAIACAYSLVAGQAS
jgi:hypothetical protein